MEHIKKYFSLSQDQLEKLEALQPLYIEWNEKINVISRKDMDNFYTHHVLHSLSIAKYIQFVKGTTVLDVGTGGGFPGIPLAILFPEAQFHLIDSIGKKIKVVDAVASAIGLQNIMTTQTRVEGLKQEYDFIVSRAVTSLPEFIQWTSSKFHRRGKNNKPNGILYLKGGDIENELQQLPKRWVAHTHPIQKWFNESFFETKALVHLY